MLSFDNVKELLEKANTISLMDCGCRVKYGHCEAPLDTCIDLNNIAEKNIARGVARNITLDEALDVL